MSVKRYVYTVLITKYRIIEFVGKECQAINADEISYMCEDHTTIQVKRDSIIATIEYEFDHPTSTVKIIR